MPKEEEVYKEHLAVKFTYDCEQGQWDQQPVRIRLNPVPFSEGGMRHLFASTGGRLRAAEKMLLGSQPTVRGGLVDNYNTPQLPWPQVTSDLICV